MKRKKRNFENKKCFKFESDLNSMQIIINCLESISQKSEIFFNKFNIDLNDNQLIEYKNLLKKYRTQLESINTNAIKSCNNAGDHQKDNASNDSIVDSDATTGRQSDDNIGDDMDSRVLEYYDKNEESGKSLKRFRCSFENCSVSSHSRANILAHLVKHTNDKEFFCFWPHCEKSFGFKKSLLSHIESFHLRKERFKCCSADCGHTFIVKSELQNHMKEQHSKDLTHNCVWIDCYSEINTIQCLWPNCGQMFKNNKFLETHIEEKHLKSKAFNSKGANEEKSDEEKQFKCDEDDCDFATNDENELKEHNSQHKSTYLPLNRRNATQPTKEELVNKYTGKPLSRRRRAKNHRCTWPACEMTFESACAVRNHLRKHTGEKPYPCDWPECGKSFRQSQGLKLHKEMIHLRLKQFKCEFDGCEAAFISMAQLTVHKTDHTGVKKFQCDWPGCEWRTNHSQQIAIHRMRTHEGINPHLKRYKTKNSSNPNSDFDFHGNLKKFVCDWPGCERRFRFESNLTTHLKWHQKSVDEPSLMERKKEKEKAPKDPNRPKIKRNKTGTNKQVREKNFTCEWPDCGASYTTKTMLSQHMNTHTGQKPFVCDQCDQSFSYGSSLRSHIQAHHQMSAQLIEKEFKCYYFGCNRSFDKNKSLQMHYKKVHEKAMIGENNLSINIENTGNREMFVNQPNVIRLDRIKAFNAMQIQTQFNPIPSHPMPAHPMPLNLGTNNRRLSSNPIPSTHPNTHNTHSIHATAKKLLSNALKRQKLQSNFDNIGVSEDKETIVKELPYPCPQPGCWRRFKSEKALEWHKKKFH